MCWVLELMKKVSLRSYFIHLVFKQNRKLVQQFNSRRAAERSRRLNGVCVEGTEKEFREEE